MRWTIARFTKNDVDNDIIDEEDAAVGDDDAIDDDDDDDAQVEVGPRCTLRQSDEVR